jgi:hypothetical protein
VRAVVEPAPPSSIWPHANGRGMPFFPSYSTELDRAPRGGYGTPFLPSSAPQPNIPPVPASHHTNSLAGGCGLPSLHASDCDPPLLPRAVYTARPFPP